MYCVIKRGGFLGSEKIVHVPEIPIGATALSAQDEEKIRTGIHLNVDVILVPGVRNSVFFNHVRKFVSKSSLKSLRSAFRFSSLSCSGLKLQVSISITHSAGSM